MNINVSYYISSIIFSVKSMTLGPKTNKRTFKSTVKIVTIPVPNLKICFAMLETFQVDIWDNPPVCWLEGYHYAILTPKSYFK